MEIVYRRLTEDDLDTFIDMRVTQLREEGASEDIELLLLGIGLSMDAFDCILNGYTV